MATELGPVLTAAAEAYPDECLAVADIAGVFVLLAKLLHAEKISKSGCADAVAVLQSDPRSYDRLHRLARLIKLSKPAETGEKARRRWLLRLKETGSNDPWLEKALRG